MNYTKLLHLFVLTLILTGCASTSDTDQKNKLSRYSTANKTGKKLPYGKIILAAENKASKQGRKVLETGRKMALIDGEIIAGGCWDYANEVYNRAGFQTRPKKRQTVFKGTQKKGPYADVSLIKPGDFLYHINHSYGDIVHSAIFIDWLDYQKKIALMLSYAGERRQVPARYIPYDLSNVYRIVRAIN